MIFNGSMVALITPFRHGGIDEQSLENLVDWHIESGTDAIVPVGTTGESPVLSSEEHLRVIEIVVNRVGGRIPVVAGAGSNNPAEAIRFTQHAQSVGADAVLSVAGYYNRPDQEGLFRHFESLHNESDIPIILYNIPSRCIVDIESGTVARLSNLPRIEGVKDATADMARLSRERIAIQKPFSWLSGDDLSALAYNVSGGNGCISVTANVAPQLCSSMQNACRGGDFTQALGIHERLFPLHQALMLEPSPAGVKYAASLMDHCLPDCRLPVVELRQETKALIESTMKSLELI